MSRRDRSPSVINAAPYPAGGDGTPTEMEAAVLGIVGRHGPCTAYAVRRVFLDHPSSSWSGSAGAIYPLVTRLEKRGLLATHERPWGHSTKRLLHLTSAGQRALERWLAAPLPVWATTQTVDPVRTRFYYLDALPPDERIRFVDDAEQKTRLYLAHVHTEVQRLDRAGEEHERLAIRGIAREMEARLDWLAEVRREMVLDGEATAEATQVY